MKTMDRRIAERRQQVTEDKARGRLRWLTWAVALVVLVAVVFWLINSPVLAIDTVTVTGAEHSNPSEVAAAIGIGPGTSTISVRGGTLESALKEDPWIAAAHVTVSWPGSVEIDVVERVPVASIVTEDGVFLVAADGMVIDRSVGVPLSPVITSDATAVRVGTSLENGATAAAVDFAAAVPPDMRGFTSIGVIRETVAAEIDGFPIVLGRPIDMAQKATVIGALFATDIEPGSRIDVTAPTRPAVAPPQSQLEGETKTLEESQPSD